MTTSPEPASAAHFGLPDGLRVLCVDDESMIGDLVTGILRTHLQYEVRTVADGLEALELLADDANFDLLIVDYVMPRMNGGEFYRQLEVLHPELCKPLMFVTGDTLNEETLQSIAATGRYLLEKPFGLPDLTQALRDLVERGAIAQPSNRESSF